jgi:pectate disaccharide-lyase
MIKPVFFVLAAALAAGAPAGATTYYVATNGNDSYSGTTLSQPFATPFKAMSSVAAADLRWTNGALSLRVNDMLVRRKLVISATTNWVQFTDTAANRPWRCYRAEER